MAWRPPSTPSQSTDETLVTGRGLAFGTALEVALKLEETCLRPVRGLSYADLRHGPIAVVGPGLTRSSWQPRTDPCSAPSSSWRGTSPRGGARVLAVGGDAALAGVRGVPPPRPRPPSNVA